MTLAIGIQPLQGSSGQVGIKGTNPPATEHSIGGQPVLVRNGGTEPRTALFPYTRCCISSSTGSRFPSLLKDLYLILYQATNSHRVIQSRVDHDNSWTEDPFNWPYLICMRCSPFLFTSVCRRCSIDHTIYWWDAMLSKIICMRCSPFLWGHVHEMLYWPCKRARGVDIWSILEFLQKKKYFRERAYSAARFTYHLYHKDL